MTSTRSPADCNSCILSSAPRAVGLWKVTDPSAVEAVMVKDMEAFKCFPLRHNKGARQMVATLFADALIFPGRAPHANAGYQEGWFGSLTVEQKMMPRSQGRALRARLAHC